MLTSAAAEAQRCLQPNANVVKCSMLKNRNQKLMKINKWLKKSICCVPKMILKIKVLIDVSVLIFSIYFTIKSISIVSIDLFTTYLFISVLFLFTFIIYFFIFQSLSVWF